MTAICGYWTPAGSLGARLAIERMCAALGMYGGDRTAQWASDSVALGVAQRFRLPEDRFDQQPTLHSGVTAVVDVRLDNRDELAGLLGWSGHRRATAADSELMVDAWLRWGPALVDRLVGPFALIVWDSRTETMFLARDQLGLAPLCYAKGVDGIAVASMPKGIVGMVGVSAALDATCMGEWLGGVPSGGDRTFFRDVAALPPGCTATVSAGRFTVHRYWQPPRAGTLRLASDDAYVDRFRELLSTAVGACLRTEGPAAATLSGGLDSTTVTTMAAKQLAARGRPLIAVTWVPRLGSIGPMHASQIANEREHAAAVVARYPHVTHELLETPDAYLPDASEVIWRATDQPVLLPAKVPLGLAMGDMLRQRGCTMLLGAAGGNLTISYDGLTLPRALLRAGQLIRWGREAQALVRTGSWSPRSALGSAIDAFMPLGARKLLRHMRRDPAIPIRTSLLRPEFAREINLFARSAERRWDLYRPDDSSADALRTNIFRRLDHGIGRKGHFAITGLDPRDPTLDRRVLEFCWAIPEDQFLRAGRTRWLLRRAMAGVLPSLVLDETRRGVQTADWPRFVLPYKDRYAADIDELGRSPAVAAILNLPFLRSLMNAWPSEPAAAHRISHGVLLARGVAAGRFIRHLAG